jgi:hypothetical protein
MNDIQSYLQDLLTIDCEIQTNLQQLSVLNNRLSFELKSNEIKQSLKQFKEKLSEMKEFCEVDMRNQDSSNTASQLIDRLSRSIVDKASSSSLSSSNQKGTSSFHPNKNESSGKEDYYNELQIQKEHLSTIESRFRNAYLAGQVKLDQVERDNLFDKSTFTSASDLAAKKQNINKKMLLNESNSITQRLSDVNKQLKWTENQTSDIIPTLSDSSSMIQTSRQDFTTMSTLINDGKRLLTRLSRREFTDKLLFFLCLCFFFTVVFYIVWKRSF